MKVFATVIFCILIANEAKGQSECSIIFYGQIAVAIKIPNMWWENSQVRGCHVSGYN